MIYVLLYSIVLYKGTYPYIYFTDTGIIYQDKLYYKYK